MTVIPRSDVLLAIRNLVANLPINALIDREPREVVALLLNQGGVLLHPRWHRIRRSDEVVEVIDVEIPHQTAIDPFQFVVTFARVLVQHVAFGLSVACRDFFHTFTTYFTASWKPTLGTRSFPKSSLFC